SSGEVGGSWISMVLLRSGGFVDTLSNLSLHYRDSSRWRREEGKSMRIPRLFVDSADTDAVAPLLERSLVHGVTTNPTVLDRADRTVADIAALHAEWQGLGAVEIFFQAWGDSRSEIERNARR